MACNHAHCDCRVMDNRREEIAAVGDPDADGLAMAVAGMGPVVGAMVAGAVVRLMISRSKMGAIVMVTALGPMIGALMGLVRPLFAEAGGLMISAGLSVSAGMLGPGLVAVAMSAFGLPTICLAVSPGIAADEKKHCACCYDPFNC